MPRTCYCTHHGLPRRYRASLAGPARNFTSDFGSPFDRFLGLPRTPSARVILMHMLDGSHPESHFGGHASFPNSYDFPRFFPEVMVL